MKSYPLPRKFETTEESSYRYVHYGDIHTGIANIINNVEDLPKIVNGKYETLDKGDLILADASEDYQGIAWPAILNVDPQENVLAGLHTIALRPNQNIDSMFLYYTFLNTDFRKFGYRMGTGMKVFGISKKNLYKYNLSKPINIEEQERISSLLIKLNNIITLEQEKFKQFKIVYHALIQKLLISDSSTGPEIRIENHHQNWVLQKVSDIFKITRGNVLAKSKVMSRKDDENIYPVFSSQTMDNGLMGYFNKYLFENAITWTTDGANAGTVTYRRDKFYSTNVNGVLLSEEGYASEVVALILNNTAYKYVSYVGNPKLMNNVMADIKIYLPTDMVELDKLNLLFVQSKNILHKMEQSTLRYKNIKKILLRNLFV